MCAGAVEANAADDPLVKLRLPPGRMLSGGSWGPIPLVGLTELSYSFSCRAEMETHNVQVALRFVTGVPQHLEVADG